MVTRATTSKCGSPGSMNGGPCDAFHNDSVHFGCCSSRAVPADGLAVRVVLVVVAQHVQDRPSVGLVAAVAIRRSAA